MPCPLQSIPSLYSTILGQIVSLRLIAQHYSGRQPRCLHNRYHCKLKFCIKRQNFDFILFLLFAVVYSALAFSLWRVHGFTTLLLFLVSHIPTCASAARCFFLKICTLRNATQSPCPTITRVVPAHFLLNSFTCLPFMDKSPLLLTFCPIFGSLDSNPHRALPLNQPCLVFVFKVNTQTQIK